MKLENLIFSELTIECKKALLEYCYMHCQTIEEAEEYYQDKLFTFEIIDIDEAKKRCMEQSEDLWGCNTFDKYHQMYIKGGDIPNHGTSKYPCIEGGYGEWLDDGWHRFHSYVAMGDTHIPILKFQSK